MTLGAGAVGFVVQRGTGCVPESARLKNIGSLKNWAWTHPGAETGAGGWRPLFQKARKAGIHSLLFLAYTGTEAYYESQHVQVKEKVLEKVLPIGKDEGLEVHAWICALICNEPTVQRDHPEWFVISQKGESTLNKPPYIPSYKWLCPSRPEVYDFLEKIVSELAAIEGIKGIHLDYIRYPDVILPEALQPKYNLVQDREYPEFDFCYCEVCRRNFKRKTGIDPLKLDNPAADKAWRNYRYESVTKLVKKLVKLAHRKRKLITAAVFATPGLSRRYVRQDWPRWGLDAYLPMIYHHYYNRSLDWVKEATAEGVKALPSKIPLYSGLFIPQIEPENMGKAVDLSLSGGARGISLFPIGAMKDEHWQNLARIFERREKEK